MLRNKKILTSKLTATTVKKAYDTPLTNELNFVIERNKKTASKPAAKTVNEAPDRSKSARGIFVKIYVF